MSDFHTAVGDPIGFVSRLQGSITTQNLVPTGTATAGSALEWETNGAGSFGIQPSGTYTGALSLQGTINGITWETVGGTPFTKRSDGTATATIGSGLTGIYTVNTAGYWKLRLTGLAAMTGTAPVTVYGVASDGASAASSGGGGGASTIADGADVAEGATTDAAATAGGTGTISAKLRRISSQIPPALGSAAMEAATPVTIATNDTIISATNTKLDTLHTDITATNLQLPYTLGQTTASGSLSFVESSDTTANAAQGSSTSGQLGALVQGAVTTSAPSYTTAQTRPLSLDTAGNLRTTGIALSATAATDTSRLAVSEPDMLALTTTSISAAAATATVTTPIASPGVVNWTSHGLSALQPVTVTGGTLPTELTTPASGATFYISATGLGANSFQLSRTPGGASVNFTGTSSGTQTGTQILQIYLQDMTGYNSLDLAVSSAGSGTITYEQSEDQQSWIGVPGLNTSTTSGTIVVLATTSTGVAGYSFPRRHRYARARVSTYTSGTQTIVGYCSKTLQHLLMHVGASVFGQAAHDAGITGNPVRISGRGLTANYTAVSTGDTTDFVTDITGSLVTLPYGIPDITWQYASTADITDTSAVEVKAAVASNRNYVTGIRLSNTDATVGTVVEIRSASTVIDTLYITPQIAATAGQNGIPISYLVPLRGGVNEAINVACLTTSAQVRVGINGFTKAA